MVNMHHIFNIVDQKNQCPYCHRELHESPWHSHFDSIKMYKSNDCECGKRVHIGVNFNGSGHDTWDKKEHWRLDPKITKHKTIGKVKNLESRIEIVKTYSMHP